LALAPMSSPEFTMARRKLGKFADELHFLTQLPAVTRVEADFYRLYAENA
jgi:hypothetical protein